MVRLYKEECLYKEVAGNSGRAEKFRIWENLKVRNSGTIEKFRTWESLKVRNSGTIEKFRI